MQWKELDKYVSDDLWLERWAYRQVRDYNPTLHDFVEKSFLKKIGATNKASKFLVLLVGLGVAQSYVLLPPSQSSHAH